MTAPAAPPIREELRGRTAYGAPQLDVAVRLNTNENSYPVPPEAARAIAGALAEQVSALNRYPDREFTALRTDLAAYLNASAGARGGGAGPALGAQHIWAGNGSNEVLQHIFQAFGGPGRSALGFTPSYSMHPLIADGTHTQWVDGVRGTGPRTPFDLAPEMVVEQIRTHRPDLVFLVSPNNPTGTAVSLGVVDAALAEAARGRAMVVIDEAYAEFARTGTPSALTLLGGARGGRLVVTRTMSKAFAFAGARVGYLAADPAVCEAFRLVRLPYHLSSLTQAAARAALAHAPTLLGTVEAIKAQRDRIVAELVGLGLTPTPSDANFVLFGHLPDAAAVWRRLLDRGVLIRDVGIAHHLRVTAGTQEETTAFLQALAAVIADPSPEMSARSPEPLGENR